MKRKIAFICLLVMLVTLVGCGEEPGTELIGRWRSSGGGNIITFQEEGVLRYENIGNFIEKGTWRVDSNKLELVLDGDKKVYEYSVQDDVLRLTIDGETSKWYK